jgi:transporter family protein
MPTWVLYAMLAVCFWGAWGMVSKLAADSIPPLLNQLLSTLGLVPPAAVALWQVRGAWKRKGLWLALAAGIAGGLGNLCFLAALTHGGQVSIVAPLAAVYPLITVLLAWIVLQEKVQRQQLVGVALAIAAIVFLNRERSVAGTSLEGSSRWLTLTIAALFLYGVSALFQKLATNIIAAEAAFVGFAAGFIPIAIVILVTNSLRLFSDEPIHWDVGQHAWLWGTLGGVLNGLGVLASLSAYRLGGKASVVTPLAALYPVVTVILAVVFLGEKLDNFRVVGVALALAGAVALSYEPDAEPAKDTES